VKKKWLVYLSLALCFSISLLFRFDQLKPEIGCEEQTYILTLQTVEIWRTQGLVQCHFTPMWTYDNTGDKHFAYYKRLEDTKGDNYYVSFPPLAFWVAYIALSPFDLVNGKLILQLLNLLLHFVSALLVYFIISKLFAHKYQGVFVPAFVAFVVYVFMPVNLYLHTDIFFPETIAQVFWLTALYLSIDFFATPKHIISKEKTLFFLACIILFLYAEWIAVFFVAILLCVFYRNRKFGHNKFLFLHVFLAFISVAGLIFLQYASINGATELIRAMGLRFLERSGFFGETYSSMGVNIFNLSSIGIFIKNLHKAFYGMGYFILLCTLVVFITNRKRLSALFKRHKYILLLATTPVFLHALIFFNANALHLLLMARWTVPLAILSGFLCFAVIDNHRKLWVLSVLMFVLCAYSFYFYRSNFSKKIDNEQIDKIAAYIKTNAVAEASVFVITDLTCGEPEKHLTYMSKRNVIRIHNAAEADSLLRINNKIWGLIVQHKDFEIASKDVHIIQ